MSFIAHNFWKCLYKASNAVDTLLGERLFSRPGPSAIREKLLARYVAGLPDRRYWDQHIMPALLNAGFQRILFVGCGSYTRHVHHQFESRGITCWTTDIDPDNARWGNSAHHVVCDIADIQNHFPPDNFDAVLFNGVMGYGVTGAGMKRIAPGLAAILRPGGHLLIGWNKGLVEDPLDLPCITGLFRHRAAWSLPARSTFSNSTHVFDLFFLD